MGSHEIWHLLVLGSTLFAAAAVVILTLGPLVLGPELIRRRPLLVGLIAAAALLLLGEWLFAH